MVESVDSWLKSPLQLGGNFLRTKQGGHLGPQAKSSDLHLHLKEQ